MPESKSIGMVGLGLLGSALADRFLKSGFTVAGFDINSDRLEEFSENGGHPVNSVEEISSFSRIVFSLPSSCDSLAVIDELIPHLHSESIIIDTTTGDPEQMETLAGRLSPLGVQYLDASVGGSSQQARNGEVIVIAGGEAAAVSKCRDLFECFALETFHVGPCGSGARMKLVLNLVLGLNRAVLAEGLSLAGAFGLDPSEALTILKSSPACSRVMETKGDKMIQKEFQPQARLSQHLKDVRLIIENGRDAGAKLPFSQLHRTLLERLEADGFGDSDNSVVIKAFE